MDSLATGYAAFGVVIFVFSLILAVLWILVPFAVFGIKPLLRQLISEQKRTNELLHNVSLRQQHLAEIYQNSPPPQARTPAI